MTESYRDLGRPFKDGKRGKKDSTILPEAAIRLPDISIVGMSNSEMERLVDTTKGLNIGVWARDVIQRAPMSLKEPQTLSLVSLGVCTMGIRSHYPTTKQIWEKAKKLGDRVSAEAMVKLAVEAAKGNVQVEIGKPLIGIMEPVTDSLGHPFVLCVLRREDGLWLLADYAYPGYERSSGSQFVVSARK